MQQPPAVSPSTVSGSTVRTRPPETYLVVAIQTRGSVAWRTVGRYVDYSAAARGVIADTLAQLEHNDGWLLTCEHLIVGTDEDGSISCWPQLVSLGADPASDRVPAAYDRQAWADWLEQVHALDDH